MVKSCWRVRQRWLATRTMLVWLSGPLGFNPFDIAWVPSMCQCDSVLVQCVARLAAVGRGEIQSICKSNTSSIIASWEVDLDTVKLQWEIATEILQGNTASSFYWNKHIQIIQNRICSAFLFLFTVFHYCCLFLDICADKSRVEHEFHLSTTWMWQNNV